MSAERPCSTASRTRSSIGTRPSAEPARARTPAAAAVHFMVAVLGGDLVRRGGRAGRSKGWRAQMKSDEGEKSGAVAVVHRSSIPPRSTRFHPAAYGAWLGALHPILPLRIADRGSTPRHPILPVAYEDRGGAYHAIPPSSTPTNRQGRIHPRLTQFCRSPMAARRRKSTPFCHNKPITRVGVEHVSLACIRECASWCRHSVGQGNRQRRRQRGHGAKGGR